MKRPVRLLRSAETDIRGIARYITRDSPQSAEKTVARLLDAIDQLAVHPESGPIAREERLKSLGFRTLSCGAYLMFYKVVRTQVRIYRVLHGKRSFKSLL